MVTTKTRSKPLEGKLRSSRKAKASVHDPFPPPSSSLLHLSDGSLTTECLIVGAGGSVAKLSRKRESIEEDSEMKKKEKKENKQGVESSPFSLSVSSSEKADEEVIAWADFRFDRRRRGRQRR